MTEANCVRAAFVRFLALGGDEDAPVHERGVQLQGAWLEGVLDLEAAHVIHRLPLWACRIERIDARNARLKFLNLSGCLLVDGFNGDGLQCDDAIFLRTGFRSTGEIRLLGATIQAVDLGEGSFINATGNALSFDGCQVLGVFYFSNITSIEGRVVMASARVGTLTDDEKSWSLAGKKLVLDGFVYDRLDGGWTDAQTRIAWLDRQWPSHLAEAFRPQPWEQLVAVLRQMGHPEAARAVAIAKQDRLRRADKVVRGARTLHLLYGLVVGYGYRPLRLLTTTAAVWMLCSLAYWAATNPAWFGAENHLLVPPRSEAEAPAPDYRNFVPLIYSADVLLPVVDLGYKDEWQPVVADAAGNPLLWGQLLRFLYWFEIAFGWVAGLLLVGVLGNLIKKD